MFDSAVSVTAGDFIIIELNGLVKSRQGILKLSGLIEVNAVALQKTADLTLIGQSQGRKIHHGNIRLVFSEKRRQILEQEFSEPHGRQFCRVNLHSGSFKGRA